MAQARTATRGEAGQARIGSGARIRGRIHGDGDLVVEGQVEGDVAIRGELTVAEGATVTSKAVEAQSVTIAGAFEGDVTATGPVRVAGGAQVRGNLRGSTVSIDEGGSKDVVPYLKETGDTIPVLLDSRMEEADKLGLIGTPGTFILNRAGKIVAKGLGPVDFDNPVFKSYIDNLAAGS